MSLVTILLKREGTSYQDLGLIPFWFDSDDPRTPAEQFNEKYEFGGWRPFPGFTLNEDDSLSYPDDPPLHPIAEYHMHGRNERVLQYDYGWVAIIQPDRSFEACRMD